MEDRGADHRTRAQAHRGQVEALLARRDRDQIVAYYDAKVSQLGEAAVLYDLPPRSGAEPPAR